MRSSVGSTREKRWVHATPGHGFPLPHPGRLDGWVSRAPASVCQAPQAHGLTGSRGAPAGAAWVRALPLHSSRRLWASRSASLSPAVTGVSVGHRCGACRWHRPALGTAGRWLVREGPLAGFRDTVSEGRLAAASAP